MVLFSESQLETLHIFVELVYPKKYLIFFFQPNREVVYQHLWNFCQEMMLNQDSDIISFYNDNADEIRNLQYNTLKKGFDQTPVNYLTHIEGIDYKKLPYEYNMCDMFRKELLNDEMTFTKCGWIYQYNSIPNNKEDKLTLHWMKKTYEHLYG